MAAPASAPVGEAHAHTAFEDALEQVAIAPRLAPPVVEARLAGLDAEAAGHPARAPTPRHGLLTGTSVFVGKSTVGDAPSGVVPPPVGVAHEGPEAHNLDAWVRVTPSPRSNAGARGSTLARSVLQHIAERETRNASLARYVVYNPPVSWRAAVDLVLNDALPLTDDECATVVADLGREGGPSLAIVAYRWLVENAEYAPGVGAYNNMIETCRLRNDPHGCFELLNDLVTRGVKGDITTFNNVLTLCGQNGLMDQALDVYAAMRSEAHGVAPNSYSFQVLVSLCGFKRRTDWRRAVWFFREMLDAGVPIDPLTPKELLTVCVRAMRESTGGSKDVVEIFEGLRTVDMADLPVVHDALIYEHARRGELEEALQRFHELPSCGVSANVDTYNALLLACRRVGAWRQSLEIFECLVQGVHSDDGFVQPTTETFNAIISTLREAGCLEKALEVFAWMDGYGVEVDATTYAELMAAVDVANTEDRQHQMRKQSVPAHVCTSHLRLEDPKQMRAPVVMSQGAQPSPQPDGPTDAEAGGGEIQSTALDMPVRPIVFDGMRWLYMERRTNETLGAPATTPTQPGWVESTKGAPLSETAPKDAAADADATAGAQFPAAMGVLLPAQRTPDKMAERARRNLLAAQDLPDTSIPFTLSGSLLKNRR